MQIDHDPLARTFTMTAGTWSSSYPLDELPKWLRFYRRQKQEFPKSGSSYDPAITALTALAARLGLGDPD